MDLPVQTCGPVWKTTVPRAASHRKQDVWLGKSDWKDKMLVHLFLLVFILEAYWAVCPEVIDFPCPCPLPDHPAPSSRIGFRSVPSVRLVDSVKPLDRLGLVRPAWREPHTPIFFKLKAKYKYLVFILILRGRLCFSLPLLCLLAI